jgi:hypothetical protein
MISALFGDNGSHHLNGSSIPVLAAPNRKGLQQQQAKVTLAHHSAERLVPCTASDKAGYFRGAGKLLLEATKIL